MGVITLLAPSSTCLWRSLSSLSLSATHLTVTVTYLSIYNSSNHYWHLSIYHSVDHYCHLSSYNSVNQMWNWIYAVALYTYTTTRRTSQPLPFCTGTVFFAWSTTVGKLHVHVWGIYICTLHVCAYMYVCVCACVCNIIINVSLNFLHKKTWNGQNLHPSSLTLSAKLSNT